MRNATGDANAGSTDSQAGQESLAQFLARTGRLPILQGFALAVQLLADLEASHRAGLVPGEISIASLRISRTGRLIVPSAGDASAQDAPRPPRPHGEVAPGLLSAAAVAYELLTGTSPFAGTNGAGTRAADRSEAPISVRARRAELPPELDPVFARALAARPEGRYRSAAEFSEALQAAMPGPHWDRSLPAARPVRVEVPAETRAPDTGRAPVPPTRPEPPVSAGRRRWFGAALASGTALAVLAVALWTGLEHVPAASTIDARAVEAVPEEPVITAAQSAPAVVDAPLEPGHAAQVEPKKAAAAPNAQAREGRPEVRRTARSHRVAGHQVVAVVHTLPPSPETACGQDLAIARDACTAFRCATSEFRHHPVCVRMHAEGARARAQLAESRGGP